MLTPYWFVEITMAQNTNIAWLRSIGAAIIGILFFGCLLIYFNPKEKFDLLKVIAITSLLQTSALIYSRSFNEFSAKLLLIIDLTILIAILVSVYFLFIILYKKKYFK